MPRFFLQFLLADRRIRIRDAQKHVDPLDQDLDSNPDPDPTAPKYTLFSAHLVRSELDDHEVGGWGEGLVLEVEWAGEGGDVGGRLLSPPPAQDLHRVEDLLRVEVGELNKEKSSFRQVG